MSMGKPKSITFIIALVGAAVAVVLQLGIISVAALSGAGFWILAGAFVLLALGCLLKGL